VRECPCTSRCAPPAVATEPSLRIVTLKATVEPADGLFGDQLTTEATRSELGTGETTRLPPVNELFASDTSTTVFASSTTARIW
jgi:hypothetical protein